MFLFVLTALWLFVLFVSPRLFFPNYYSSFFFLPITIIFFGSLVFNLTNITFEIPELNRSMYLQESIRLTNLSILTFTLSGSFLIRLLPQLRLPDFSILINDKKFHRYLFRVGSSLVIVFLLLSIPFLVQTNFLESGLYGIIIGSPLTSVMRENTYKLAEVTFQSKMYGYGRVIALYIYPLLFTCFASEKQFTKRIVSLMLFLLVVLISNIHGSRGGFIEPFFYIIFAWYLTNTFHLRNKIQDALGLARRFLYFSLPTVHKSNLKFIRVLIVCLIIFVLGFFLLSALATGILSNYDQFHYLLYSVVTTSFNRILIAPYTTGLQTIQFGNQLGLGFQDYIGGFPGVTIIFPDIPDTSIFRTIGEYSGFYFRGIAGDTNNLNTSGIFLNTLVWGVFGSSFFAVLFTLNLYVYRKLLVLSARSCNIYASATKFLILSIPVIKLSVDSISSVISIFPVIWFITVLLVVCIDSLTKKRLFKGTL